MPFDKTEYSKSAEKGYQSDRETIQLYAKLLPVRIIEKGVVRGHIRHRKPKVANQNVF